MRYTPHTEQDRQQMLERIGVSSIEELFSVIPDELRLKAPIDLPPPLSEPEAVAELRHLAGMNAGTARLVCFAGAGAYDHYIPAIVDAIISRPEFYTAYTPYQPEVSQGTLQSIYEFQSLVCRLTAMEVANASMYDCASALAEAAHMARDITRRNQILVSAGVNPTWVEVVKTYCHGLNIPVVALALQHSCTDTAELTSHINDNTAAVMVQHPNFFGMVEPMRQLATVCHSRGALLVVAVDPISLGILAPPGDYDADIVVAEGQSLGIPLNFGGPYLGIMATKKKYVRHLPGRVVARTADLNGQTGYVLALQTREQHIRREKATSNICTNQALCALAATVYLSVMGRTGIREVAIQCMSKAHYLAQRIAAVPGFTVEHCSGFFREFVVSTPVPAAQVVTAGTRYGILAGVDLGKFRPEWRNRLLVAVTERRTRAEMDSYTDFIRQEFS
ncbi:MAG: aminomethyl-transferring glycine dehydrogenase subunit GcvPA [candidate division WOR-3 bacterium]